MADYLIQTYKKTVTHSISSKWDFSYAITGGNSQYGSGTWTATLPFNEDTRTVRVSVNDIPSGATILWDKCIAKNIRFDNNITSLKDQIEIHHSFLVDCYVRINSQVKDGTWVKKSNGEDTLASAQAEYGGSVVRAGKVTGELTIIYVLGSKGTLTADNMTVTFTLSELISAGATHTIRWYGAPDGSAFNSEEMPIEAVVGATATRSIKYSEFGDNDSLIVYCDFVTNNEGNITTQTLPITVTKPAVQEWNTDLCGGYTISHAPEYLNGLEEKSPLAYCKRYAKLKDLEIKFSAPKESVLFDDFVLSSSDNKLLWSCNELIELPDQSKWNSTIIVIDDKGAWQIPYEIDIQTVTPPIMVDFYVTRCGEDGIFDPNTGNCVLLTYTLSIPEGKYFTNNSPILEINYLKEDIPKKAVLTDLTYDESFSTSERAYYKGEIRLDDEDDDKKPVEFGPDDTPTFDVTLKDKVQTVAFIASSTLMKASCVMHIAGDGGGVGIGTFCKGTLANPEFRCAYPMVINLKNNYYTLRIGDKGEDGFITFVLED